MRPPPGDDMRGQWHFGMRATAMVCALKGAARYAARPGAWAQYALGEPHKRLTGLGGVVK